MRLQPSSARLRHLRPVAPVQFPPEPQVSLNQNTSVSSYRRLGSVLADTNSTSSGTSAAAESSLSSVSSVFDRRGQQALSIHGRRRPPENSSAEGEADPTTEVQEVVPCKGPTTGNVDIIIFGNNFPSGQLYVRFGDATTCTVSEALGRLGTGLIVFAVEMAERKYSAMHSPHLTSSVQSQGHFVPGAVCRLS